MKRLVLDIRENPGGPLDQAIKVSNRFLKKGDLIVYTRGRIPNSDQDYHARRKQRLSPIFRWSPWPTAERRARRKS